MRNKRILICGGHLTPALAVIEELKKRGNYEIYYVGRKLALEQDQAISLEAQVLSKLQVHFLPIITGRWPRYFSLSSLFSLLKIPMGLVTSLYYLFTIKPEKIVTFGGYVSLPVCLVGRLMGIPIVVSEQTRVLGLANKIIGRWAKVLCLAWYETKGVPKSVKTEVTGIPIRRGIIEGKKERFIHPGNPKLPLIYITGGSLGAMVINRVIGDILTDLASDFRIIHQCGSSKNELDFRHLSLLKEKLPYSLRKNYLVVKHLDPETVGSILRQASLVIGRSGANTVAEVAICTVPAILIPLSFAGGNEQEDNASLLEKTGSVVVLDQKDLKPEVIYGTIKNIISNLSKYKENAVRARNLYPTDAAQKVVDLL